MYKVKKRHSCDFSNMFKTIIFMAILRLWIVVFWVGGSHAPRIPGWPINPIVYNANRNDCPDLEGCICKKAQAYIRCTNVNKVPKLPNYIQKVQLSENSITELKRTDFTHNGITELFLSNNNIKTVDEDAFTDLTELKHINLSNNNIVELKENVFQNNKNLKQVYLENNLHLVFTATSLPASIEDLNLFNTSSTLLYNQLPNLFRKLGTYHGIIYLNDERTLVLECQGAIIRNNEDLNNAPISNSTSTEKPKSTPTSTEKTNTNSPTTMKPEEQSEVVPPKTQQEMRSEINCQLYWAIIAVLIVTIAVLLLFVVALFAKNNAAHQTMTGPRQEQEQRLVPN